MTVEERLRPACERRPEVASTQHGYDELRPLYEMLPRYQRDEIRTGRSPILGAGSGRFLQEHA